MGHRPSTFRKEDFKRGIRGYRDMFASVHLKEKELKKLWVEFGKIDKDGGRTVSGWVSRVAHILISAVAVGIRVQAFVDEDEDGT